VSNPLAVTPNGTRTCPRCNQTFTCGLSAHLEKCWCFDRPHVIDMKDASREGCVCPACLDKQIAAIQARDKEANVG
jgi:hypothetical protein